MTMQITRTSTLTGTERTRTIDITPQQYEAWQGGVLIQEAMPHLSPSDREFLMTGITDEEWDEMFGEEE